MEYVDVTSLEICMTTSVTNHADLPAIYQFCIIHILHIHHIYIFIDKIYSKGTVDILVAIILCLSSEIPSTSRFVKCRV